MTIAPIEGLRTRIKQLTDWTAQASATSATLHVQAEQHHAACGAILVPRSQEWTIPPSIRPDVERATALVAGIAEHDRAVADLKGQEGRGNIFDRLGAWRQGRRVVRERMNESSELRTLLISIAMATPQPTIPEAAGENRAATDLMTQALGVDQQVEATRTSLAALTEELRRREESITAMGFDALYEAALLQTSGLPPVDSPLLLKAGEVAYLSVPATLARMVTRTHYVGASSGFSFPVGRTGIRYRVGSFRGQPVQQQSLTRLDTGAFVLSSQRLAFIGSVKSTSVSLAKILHLEVYNDALAVFQQGRENPDFYLMSQPRRAVFLINWVLSRQSDAKQ
ncbi:MAG TPA: hypothetical protein VJR46_08990 [Candidatus Dormibacteraeota bacterium]|nr:hypothetical protein [Candidatus Dormibacteraeota bacterium]